VTMCTLLLIRERAEPSRSAGKLLGVVLGVFGQHAFNPGEDVEERIDTFVDRITDGAQRQDARPGCTGQRQDGAKVGVGGDQDPLVGDGEGHHLVVGVPGPAEDPDRVVSCPAVTGRSDGKRRPRANPGTDPHGAPQHLGSMRPRRDAPGTV